LPVSVAAGMIAKKQSARLGLSALLCTLGLSAAVLWLMHRFDQPPHFVARSVLLMMAGILGSGCALYLSLKAGLQSACSRREALRREPNTRVQRTRSSPSALREPLTRRPLGRTKAVVARRTRRG